jgi:hypothetical protein
MARFPKKNLSMPHRPSLKQKERRKMKISSLGK